VNVPAPENWQLKTDSWLMTWIKICGTTNLEDALTAVEAGADALGFVFYEKSPRKIDPEAAREIVAELPARVEKVGVFVSETAGDWSEIAELCGLTAAQVHLQTHSLAQLGQDAGLSAVCSSPPQKIYLALPAAWLLDQDLARADLSSFIARSPERPFGTIFLDSGTARQPGGTGRAFDWARARTLVDEMSKGVNVVIAGGLNPGNVTEAIHLLKPWGVDVASGVETSPGKKDPEKIRAFVAAVRTAEKDG
jgi:phosphoribosylanthranilate isomerase